MTNKEKLERFISRITNVQGAAWRGCVRINTLCDMVIVDSSARTVTAWRPSAKESQSRPITPRNVTFLRHLAALWKESADRISCSLDGTDEEWNALVNGAMAKDRHDG